MGHVEVMGGGWLREGSIVWGTAERVDVGGALEDWS